jgi:hypothetical protein
VLLHDNARTHTAAAHTAETLQKLKFDVMAHPPYSPDLAPSDCDSQSTQRGIKGPSIHLGIRSEGSGACVARFSAQKVLFRGHKEPAPFKSMLILGNTGPL